jgi:predicted nucleotidyltransferase
MIPHILAELRERLKALYGGRFSRMILYGSQARGDAEPGSDIDVLVILHGPVSPSLEIARTGAITAALSLHYDVVISCAFVSAEHYATIRSPWIMNIQREGVAL